MDVRFPEPSPLRLGRFRVVKALGKGGESFTYIVHDERTGERLALKELRSPRPDAVVRLKREYRILSAIRHPNLVRLRELHDENGRPFFTMELVEGASLFAWIHDVADAERPDRLRQAIDAITSALSAIHAAGYAHCDLKSDNIHVDRNGRVVVLDLGLSSLLRPNGAPEPTRRGTPNYMAPEQASGGRVTEATDLYALGVILYAGLTGRMPYTGPADTLLRDRQIYEAAWPYGIEAPVDLRCLCLDLLRIDATLRPTIDDVRSRLGLPALQPAFGFFGREKELSQLRAVASESGTFRPVLIEGESGIGKTTLIERFVASADGAIALTSRCYERENVPYNALDGLVDGLTRVIEPAELREALSMLPEGDRDALLCQFPVLQSESAPNRPSSPRFDLVRARLRAEAALRLLFRAVAGTKKLILWVDDVHWADADSLRAIATLFAPPSPPAVVLLLTARRLNRGAIDELAFEWPRATNMMKCLQSCRLPMQPLHGFQILDCGGTA
jgi:eukaryotic-like serine/threonine-protein kinase